jgi:AcrR family transcriptional regulator
MYDMATAKATPAVTQERTADRVESLAVWSRTDPAARRPRFTRDDIAAAAMSIADQEGLDAVSMRRIAAELGAGTMTLYHYVRTKDEVLTLVVDRLLGEVLLRPDEPMPADWRAALTLIARRTRDALMHHPWILDITDDPFFGPNGLRHFDELLGALSTLPITLEEKMEIITAIDEFVFGHCMQARNNAASTPDDVAERLGEYVSGLVAEGNYPELARLVEHEPMLSVWRRLEAAMGSPDRFDRTLQRLLDGIERDVLPSRTARRAPSRPGRTGQTR